MDKKKTIIIGLAFLVLVGLWLQSTAWFRVRLADHYYIQDRRDKAILLYIKVLRKDLVSDGELNIDRKRYGLKLMDIYFKDIREKINSIEKVFDDQVNMYTLQQGVNQYKEIDVFNKRYSWIFSEIDSQEWKILLNTVYRQKHAYCIKAGQALIKREGLDKGREFYTKDIPEYFSLSESLEMLNDFYNKIDNTEMKQLIWGDNIYVVLEDFKDRREPYIKNWTTNTISEVRCHEISEYGYKDTSETLNIDYQQTGYDYWALPVSIPLNEIKNPIGLRFFIKSKNDFHGNMVVNIIYPDSNSSAVITSTLIEDAEDGWESLYIENVYNRAKEIAQEKGWSINNMYVDRVGINTGGVSNEIYMDEFQIFIL